MIIFCKECNNMLYPKEDKQNKELLYACRNCNYKEKAENPCIYRHEILQATEDKTVIYQDIVSDPTLPRTNAKCEKCGNKEAVYFQSSSKDEAMTLYFVCCNCKHKWKE